MTRPVMLVVPPILYPGIPTLGTSLLAAECARAGVPAGVHHASISFAAGIGFDRCMRLAAAPPRQMLGEGIFLAAAFPERTAEHLQVLERLSRIEDPMSQLRRPEPLGMEDLASCAAAVPGFIDRTVRDLLAGSPRIVGFSAMCQQMLASIAIGREIKRLRPDVITVLGGANATEPMGSAILEITSAFDFVFSGEADVAFPAFCRAWLESGKLPQTRVIGCAPVADLDGLPVPDYDDYFAAVAPYRSGDPVMAAAPYWLIYESSRGCWWGEKRACTFCGFNAPGGRYRVKSPGTVVAQMAALAGRYGVTALYASDNVMAPDFPRTVLPQLAGSGAGYTLFYEVKSGLKESDLDNLARAGVIEIQPGIESLSSHILELMSKGVTALENVRLLRNARSRGLTVVWNFLTAVPGEAREDYEQALELIPLLEHLQPPTRWGPLRISRYSPYHRDPARYGIRNVRPWSFYSELYGAAGERIAQHFTGEYDTGFTTSPELQARLDASLRAWALRWDNGNEPVLEGIPQADGSMRIVDRRRAAVRREHCLPPACVAALECIRQPVRADRIPGVHCREVERLRELRLAALYEGEYLALVTDPSLARQLRSRA